MENTSLPLHCPAKPPQSVPCGKLQISSMRQHLQSSVGGVAANFKLRR